MTTDRDRKINQFFELIRAVYGASRCDAQWPSPEYLMAAKQMWGDLIDRHTPAELKAALNHAQKMAMNGEDDWHWPNVGLILSGAKGPSRNSASVQALLDAPPETPEEKAARLAVGRQNIDRLKALLSEPRKTTDKQQGESV